MMLARTRPSLGGGRSGFGTRHRLTAPAALVGGRDWDLDAELVGPLCLALINALQLRGVFEVQHPAALLLARIADLYTLCQPDGKGLLQDWASHGRASNDPDQPADAAAKEPDFAAHFACRAKQCLSGGPYISASLPGWRIAMNVSLASIRRVTFFGSTVVSKVSHA